MRAAGRSTVKSSARMSSKTDAPDLREQLADRRAWRSLLLRLGGSAVILGVLFLLLPLDDLGAALQRLGLRDWLTGLGIFLVMHGIGVVKWHMAVNAAGARLAPVHAVRCYYAGLFGNTFLPSVIGGDVVRAGLALPNVRSKAGLLLGSVVERALDMGALAMVAGIGVLLIPGALDPSGRRTFQFVALAFVVAGIVALAGARWFPVRRFRFKHRRKLARMRQAFRAVAARPGRMVTVLLLGMVLQVCMVSLAAWLGRACGLDAPLRIWLFVWPLAKLSAVVPVTQGGIGVREAAQAALFAPFGVPAALAVAVSLVWQSIVLAGGLAGGLLSLVLGRSLHAPAFSDRATTRPTTPV